MPFFRAILDFLKAVKAVWMKFSHALGFVMSKIMLTIFWTVVFGIYGIILKLIRLVRRPDRTVHWIPAGEKPSDLHMQF
jgi:hypothetical protein